MDYMSCEGPSFIPFTRIIRKATNQSPVHLSTREEAWMLKENKIIYSPNGLNSSSYDASLPFHSLKRAIFTILSSSTQILVVNSTACKLLNYSPDELCMMKFQNLIQDHYKSDLLKMIDNLNDANQGGNKKEKMVELVSKDGDVIPASIFFKKIDSPQRCIAVVEPIDRKTAVLTVDTNGKILTCDEEATSLFQYDSSELVGSDIRAIIPSICLDSGGESRPEVSYKQRLTGKNKCGVSFPLCLVVSRSSSVQGIWQVVVWMFTSLSGLIILNQDLRISNCNYQFTKLVFGATKDNVLNQKITKFIPTFCEDVKLMSCQPDVASQNDSSDNSSPKSEGRRRDRAGKGAASAVAIAAAAGARRASNKMTGLARSDQRRSWNKCECRGREASTGSNLSRRLSKSDCDLHLGREWSCKSEGEGGHLGVSPVSESTAVAGGASRESDHASGKFGSEGLALKTKQKKEDYYFDYKHLGPKEGYFSGNGKHWDGNDINIYYKVKIITFGDKLFYCVWISRDPEEINDVSPNMPSTVTGSSSVISTSMDDTATKDSSYNEDLTRHSSASVLSQNDEVLTGGEYAENYTNIEQIGKGAFGYVKLAYRHSDGLLVVTKFIKKQKINAQSWVYDSHWSVKVPLEISLLTNLRHPNIIEVLDVFHNESFFQLVMKKHGAGMDLFEFIERKPNCDEKLNSYIFRQIVSAVHYLDSIGILHRDIKDENVIINERFEIKLIDFGSAAFKPPGKMFSVFYGTVEYCSPEVLQGNRYRGPELEIWSLGVTLYVLVFGENPFYDAQETIKGQFSIPVPISTYLFDLIHKMLEKDVEARISIGRVAAHPWVTQAVDIDKYRFEEIVHCNPGEADPPRYITEFTFEKQSENDPNLDGDGDRTMASSNSFCSLQTTENTENFDQYDENLQDFGGDFLTDDSMYKSSTPVSGESSKNRGDMTKSAGALNRVCDSAVNFKSQVCDRCNYKNFIKKRFSLDLNTLKRLSSSSKCSESECSFEPVVGGATVSKRDNFNEKLEIDLVNDLDEMKLVPNENGSKSYLFDPESFKFSGRVYNKYVVDDNDEEEDDDDEEEDDVDDDDDGDVQFGNELRERTMSHGTESNQSAYPEFYDTSDSRSFDGEDSECFWDAENKFRNADDY